MINNYIKEFLAIVKYLVSSEQGNITGDYLIVKKDVVHKLLDKNSYETVENKLKIWKGLNWISSDSERLTRRIRQDGENSLVIKINHKVYMTLEKISKK